MHTPNERRTLRRFALPLVAALAALPALAQDAPGDGIATAWHIEVAEGQREAFEAKVKEFNAFLADKEGAWEWSFFSVLTGPDTGDYIVRSGSHDWADFDVEQDWEDEADAWFDENLAPLVGSMTRTMTRADPQVQAWPKEEVEFRYFNVRHWYVNNGHAAAFQEGLRKVHGHLRDGAYPGFYGAWYSVSGLPGNLVMLVSAHRNWADMAEPTPSFDEVMLKAMTEEELGEFWRTWGKTYETGETFTVAYRPDLSFNAD